MFRKSKTMKAILLSSMIATAGSLSALPVYAAGSHPIARLYNPNTGEHFYTAYRNELNTLQNLGWQYEGTGWTAPDSGWYVYRLYNPNTSDHHYTMDVDECNALIRLGWKYEGIAFASPSLGWTDPDEASGIPVYRLYNPNSPTASHHYTTNPDEANTLADLGWSYEGIGWYALQ